MESDDAEERFGTWNDNGSDRWFRTSGTQSGWQETTRANKLNSLTNICVSITINVVYILVHLYVVMRQPEVCVTWEPVASHTMDHPDASWVPGIHARSSVRAQCYVDENRITVGMSTWAWTWRPLFGDGWRSQYSMMEVS